MQETSGRGHAPIARTKKPKNQSDPMKLGFATNNTRKPTKFDVDARVDRFLNFSWLSASGTVSTIQFFNQVRPEYAVKMLRQMADKIESKHHET